MWNYFVNSQKYQQLFIEITEKHIHAFQLFFNFNQDTDSDADSDMIFVWQSDHCSLQQAQTYKLNDAYFMKLQSVLFKTYA